MTRNIDNHSRPAGHVRVPAVLIGILSMLLVVGLERLGILDRLNGQIANLVARNGTELFPKRLPDWGGWLAAAGFSLALAAAMLGTSGHLRRVVLWISTVVLVAAWAPVLSLAAHAPEIAAPVIATIWSGMCAMVYAANHRMACDVPHPLHSDAAR